MKPNLYSFIIICSIFFLSCKSAEKLYQKGKYDEAVVLAAKKLQKKPGNAELIEVLQDAYRFAVNGHESKIRNLANSNSDLRWEYIYAEYQQLQGLYEAIRRSPSVFDIVQPTDYSSYMATYKEEAGNARYERGLELMDQGSKQSYRQAYYEFQKALALKPGDLSTREKMQEAYESAVTNVIILPLNRFGYQYTAYDFDYRNFNYEMLRYLNNNKSTFVRYYSPSEAGSGQIRTDNSVEMRFSDVNIGRYRDERNTREVNCNQKRFRD